MAIYMPKPKSDVRIVCENQRLKVHSSYGILERERERDIYIYIRLPNASSIHASWSLRYRALQESKQVSGEKMSKGNVKPNRHRSVESREAKLKNALAAGQRGTRHFQHCEDVEPRNR